MISETLPLNEWPSERLKDLEHIILLAAKESLSRRTYQYCREFQLVVKSAIKDAEEREAKLPFE
jgi:hypothetical protein